MLTAVCVSLFAFTACEDNGGGSGKPYSELVGSYAPTFQTITIPDVIEEPSPTYFFFMPTWSDPQNIPTVNIAIFGPDPMPMPMNTICGMLQGIVSQIVQKGLVSLELKNDGSFGASYYDLIMDPNNALGSLMDPKFGTEVKSFPSPETAAVLPDGAVGYYTDNGKFYFKLSKGFIKQLGSQMEPATDLTLIIDEMLGMYKDLGIVSTNDYYAIPLKYTTLEDGTLKLYVNRAMMLPFKDLLIDLLGSLELDPSVTMGVDPADMVKKLYENTTDLDIALFLKRR